MMQGENKFLENDFQVQRTAKPNKTLFQKRVGESEGLRLLLNDK